MSVRITKNYSTFTDSVPTLWDYTKMKEGSYYYYTGAKDQEKICIVNPDEEILTSQFDSANCDYLDRRVDEILQAYRNKGLSGCKVLVAYESEIDFIYNFTTNDCLTEYISYTPNVFSSSMIFVLNSQYKPYRVNKARVPGITMLNYTDAMLTGNIYADNVELFFEVVKQLHTLSFSPMDRKDLGNMILPIAEPALKDTQVHDIAVYFAKVKGKKTKSAFEEYEDLVSENVYSNGYNPDKILFSELLGTGVPMVDKEVDVDIDIYIDGYGIKSCKILPSGRLLFQIKIEHGEEYDVRKIEEMLGHSEYTLEFIVS